VHGAGALKNISAGNRYPSGRRRQEHRPKHAGANNLAARVHEGFRTFMKLGLRPEWASQVGLLHLDGRLTELEMQAAILYAQIAARYDHYHPNADRIRRVARGQVYDAARGEIDEVERHRTAGTIADYEHRARRAQKKWKRVEDYITDRQAREILDQVCLNDLKITDAAVPSLKLSLATLASRFALKPYTADAIVENRRRERELPVSKRVHLAVEAVSRWFAEANDTPETFRLGEAREKGEGKAAERGIRVSGHDKAGGKVSRVVLIRCQSRDLFGHIDSLFLTACTQKGWKEG
jgi:hypothetical protein